MGAVENPSLTLGTLSDIWLTSEFLSSHGFCTILHYIVMPRTQKRWNHHREALGARIFCESYLTYLLSLSQHLPNMATHLEFDYADAKEEEMNVMAIEKVSETSSPLSLNDAETATSSSAQQEAEAKLVRRIDILILPLLALSTMVTLTWYDFK